MAGPDESYDPAQFARGVVKNGKLDDSDESGVGLRAEKNPTATMRVFGSSIGNQWLMYGGIGGGLQDYQPAEKEDAVPGCDWFLFYYRGVLRWKDKEVFGDWKVRVEGSGLEPIAHRVGKQVLATLRIGSTEASKVESIEITPYQPVTLGRDRDEDEDD